MSRLALRVRWWQLGRDGDISLIGDPQLNKRIESLRTALFRFGQDVRMGLCSDWDNVDAHTGDVKWDFMSKWSMSGRRPRSCLDCTKRSRGGGWM